LGKGKLKFEKIAPKPPPLTCWEGPPKRIPKKPENPGDAAPMPIGGCRGKENLGGVGKVNPSFVNVCWFQKWGLTSHRVARSRPSKPTEGGERGVGQSRMPVSPPKWCGIKKLKKKVHD